MCFYVHDAVDLQCKSIFFAKYHGCYQLSCIDRNWTPLTAQAKWAYGVRKYNEHPFENYCWDNPIHKAIDSIELYEVYIPELLDISTSFTLATDYTIPV